jgi:hypothetical protein
MTHPSRGFTLLISLILTSVTLALGVALLDIAYKQILLASSAKQSQYAFYNADSMLECTLYWDQKFNAFNYEAPLAASSISCSNRTVTGYTSSVSGTRRTTTFNHTCASGGTIASVTIYKESSGQTNIFANGLNTCDTSSPLRIERGIKARY